MNMHQLTASARPLGRAALDGINAGLSVTPKDSEAPIPLS